MPQNNCDQRRRPFLSRSASGGRKRRQTPRLHDRRLLIEALEARLALNGDPVSASQRQALINGLEYLAGWTSDLAETAQLASPLAISGVSIGQSANVEHMIQTGIVDPLAAATQSAVNTDQFVDALRGLSRTAGDLTIVVTPASVTGGLVTGPGRNELRFTADVVIQRQSSVSTTVDLGSNVQNAGLIVESNLPLSVTSQLQFSLAFGLNLMPGLSSDQAFFIRPTNFSLGTSIDGTNLSGNSRIGLLASQLTGGAIDLDARIQVQLTNIDLDPHGNITTAELQQNPISVMAFQQTTQSSLSGTLPITATLGGQSFNASTLGSTPTLQLSSSNVFAGPELIAATPNDSFRELQNFQHLPASGLITALTRAGRALEDLAPELDINADLGGFGYTSVLTSDVVDLELTMARLARTLYEPLIQGVAPMNLGTGFALANDAVFTIRINDDEQVSVNIPRTSQGAGEPIASFVQRFLPQSIRSRITVGTTTNTAGESFFTFRAVDPEITKFEVLFASTNNSISTSLGISPGAVSRQDFKFNSLQAFSSLLAQNSGVANIQPAYDTVTNQLAFRSRAVGAPQSTNVPLKFEAGLGPLTITTPASATFTVTPTFDGRVAIDLDQLQSVLTATGDAPANGQLTSLATFRVSLDGAPKVNVSVPRDTSNSSIDDLVTDINVAIAQTSLKGKLSAGRNGSRLTLISGTGTGLLVDANAGDPAVTELKLVGAGLLTNWDRALSLASGAQLELSTAVSTSGLTGPAALGILPVDITTGSMNITSSASGLLNRELALFELKALQLGDVQLPEPSTSLAGNFVTTAASTLGATAANPGVFTLTLATPNQWATRLIGLGDLPANGRLTAPANMLIKWGEGDSVLVTVQPDSTNQNIDDLIADINVALNNTRLDGNVLAQRVGDRVALVTSGFYALEVQAEVGDSADTLLRLRGTSAPRAITHTLNTVFQQRLAPIADFRLEDFIGTVRGILDLFEQDNLRSLTSDLPLIDQSLDDILGTSQRIRSAIVDLEARAGLALKLATQAIVENLSDAIAALPDSVLNGDGTDLIDVYQRLRIASLNAERQDLPSPVNLASVIIASLAPYNAAIAKVNAPGIDMVPLNNVRDQLTGVTPSLLQLASAFATAMGVGTVTGTFTNAKLDGFEQAMLVGMTWSDPLARAVPLTDINLPDDQGLGSLRFGENTTLTLSATRDFKFDFGFNFTTDTPFLQDTSRFNSTATMTVSGPVYAANVGGVAVNLGHPSEPTSILLRTTTNATPARFNVTLNTTPNTNDIGNIPMASAASSLNYSAVSAKLDATFPVYITGNDRGNITATWTVPTTSPPAEPVVTVPPDLIPTLESSPYDFSLLTEGIELFNERLKDLVRNEILDRFPLIAPGVNIDAGFINVLDAQFYSAVVNAISANGAVDSIQLRNDLFANVETALNSILVAGSLEVSSTGSPEVRFRIRGTDMYQSQLDADLRGLNFNVANGGQVNIEFDYDLLLGFGLSLTEGFYFIVQRLPEEPEGPQFKLDIAAELALGSTMQTQLMAVPVSATPKANASGQSETRASGRVNATFIDVDNRLSIDQVDSSLFADELDIVLGTGGATSTISLTVASNALDAITGDPDLPDFTTDLLVVQTFSAGDELNEPGAIPQVRFNDIGITLGDSIARMIQPIVEQADEYLEAIRPVLESLNEEVPVLSDLRRAIGEEPLTWIEALEYFLGESDTAETVREVVEIVAEIDSLISQLRAFDSDARLVFGSYVFNSNFDLRIERPNGIDPFTAGVFIPDPLFTSTSDGTVSPAVGNADPAAQNLMDDDLNSIGFRFPIFENPQNIVSLLFGRDITFITWDIPPFDVALETPDLYLATIPIPTPIGPIPLSIYASINFEFSANIGVGFDSRGMREGQNFLDGLYFRDRGESGPPVFALGPGVTLTAAIGIPAIVEAGVEGQLSADVQARWNNIDRNGRYHLDELLENLANGPACVMNLSGAVVVGVNLFFTLFGARTDIPILPDTTLFDFGIYSCNVPRDPELAEITTILPTLDFEGVPLQPGTLVLNIGPYAERRNPGVSEDDDERIEVSQISPGVYRVRGFGETKFYGSAANPVLRIYGDAGEGTNFVDIDNSVTVPVTLVGGDGDDTLRGGSGPNRIVGRGGRDLLYGGIANDIIVAGGSDDINEAVIFGGPGDDNITAINGYNNIDGEGGSDFIQGGTGIDLIYGGRGSDQIFGGGGADQLYGEQDNDIIWGQGEEGVTIHGGRGDNALYGSNGPDLIYASVPDALPGESGRNLVMARDGDDVVYGGIDNYTEIHGGADDDLLYGGEVGDLIFAGSGTDTVYGYGGDDIIYADSGNNTIFGGIGNDLIFGSSGLTARPANWPDSPPNFINTYAGSGVDTIYGEAGNDTIYGGAATGTIDGGANADFIYGGTGVQTLQGAGGDDLIRTGDGNQIISGGAGNDLLEQSLSGVHTLTDGTLLGRGLQVYQLIERIRLINPSMTTPAVFDVSNFRGVATVVGNAAGDAVRAIVDADVDLADGNLKTSQGTSVRLENVTRALVAGIGLDNTFNVSLWTGEAVLTGGLGNDRVVSARDTSHVLSDGQLIRGSGGSITLSGIRFATLAGGASNNILDATSFTGSAWLYGGAGDDTLRGGNGDDYLDGGPGFDVFFGNGGNDVLVATASSGSTFAGGQGDDLFYGSDGLDFGSGDAGQDRIYGRGGNDMLGGGSGDDIIDGGEGDDTLSGDAGADVLVGAGGNDTLYAFNLAGSGDDAAVNYLYGDFGTGGSEPGTGNDTLRAGLGNDLSFGEAGVNTFLGGGAGAVTSDGLASGLRPSSPPAEPPIPQPPAWPPQLPGQSTTFIIDGITSSGRWTELNGSGSASGLSRSPAEATAPAVAVSAAGSWVTWIDERSGSPQVYVALHTIAGWSEYAGSARGGGISLQSGIPNSRAEEPSIAIDAIGLPIIAWTQVVGNSRDIMVARYDAIANGGAGAWVPLGSSLSSGGISGTGLADNAQVVMTSSGPVVAWLENIGGIKNVYAKRFQNGNWVALGTGGASGTGISNSATMVPQFALAAQGANVSVAWTQSLGTRTQIYLRSLINDTWSATGSSASDNGISQSTGSAMTPALVYFGNGEMIAAWQDTSSSVSEIYAARFDGSQWTEAGLGSRTGGGVSNTQGNAIAPKLAAIGEDVSLVWQDNRRTAGKGNSTALYTKRWQGSQFIEDLIGDARDRGLSTIVGSPRTHAVAVDAAGHPFVVWSDTVSGKSEIYLQVNKLDLGTVHYVNDSDSTIDAQAANVFSTAIGNDDNDGLTPATPKRTLQSVLNDPLRPMNVGDVILLDAGTYVGTAITGTSPTGVIIIGSSDEPSVIQTPLTISNVDRLTVSRLQTTAGVTVTSSTKVTLQENDLRNAGIAVSGGNSIQVVNNQFFNSSTAVMLSGDTTAAVVASNTIRDGSRGIWLTTGATAQAATGLVVRDNRMLSTDVGVAVEASAQGRISQNWIDDANTGLRLISTFEGLITNNIISDASTGVLYQAANTLDGNLIYGGMVGIATNINSNTTGLGYFGLAAPNRIVNNTTGISLSNNALVQQQYLWGNSTGIAGSGSIVPTAFAFANMIGGSNVGVDVSGTVQYTRMHRNTTGVAARNGQLIAHNELVNNTRGIDISGDQNVRVFSNTLVGTSGTNIRVVNAASQTEVRNNILVTDSGYNLYVDNNSTAGFFSDYNNLTAGPAGKLVYWTKDFTDILDWQEDVYQFDLNSSGTTVIDQRSATPRFVSRALNDYRVFDLTARLRFTSPTIDVGDARVVEASAPDLVNLLANPSFEQGLNSWTVTPATSNIGTANPTAHVGSNYFRGGTGATVLLEQTVDLISAGYLPVNIDALQYTATFSARVRSAAEAVADRGILTVTFLDAANAAIGLPRVVAAANVSDRWELIGEQTYLPALTRSIRFQYTGTRLTGTSNDIYLDGALLALTPRSEGVDVGALGNAATDVDSAAHIHLITPDLYKDWERNKAIDIRWQSFGNTAGSGVAIKLLQDTALGPQLVTSITTSTVDDGQFTWIAANSGVNFGTAGLRIEVSLVTNPTILDRSTETFSVPENTNTYFVNDRASSGDEYTSTPGSNRNTGKVATAPKPYPNNVLRIYTLGAGDMLSIDTGEYPLLSPLVISNSGTLGDDEGFLMRGVASRDSQLSHANPLTVAPVLTLIDADLMTVNHLQLVGGTLGLSVRDGSTNFNADRVQSIGATQLGMLIDSGSSAGTLSRLLVDGSLGPGLKIEVPLGSLTDSVIRNNAGTGLELIDVGPAVIEANQIFNNVGTFATGVQITQSFTASPTFGSLNLETGRGNIVHSNSRGVKVQGTVSVVGNTIYNHIGTNSYGIESNGNSTLSRNVIYGNTNGIVSGGTSLIQENRLYNHSGTAIVALGGSSIQRNVVYSNSIGVRANTGTIANNVLYANADASVALSPASNLTLVNNTIVQTTGDGVQVSSISSNVGLRNNNIWARGGFALNVASDSQTGFQSDFNNLLATGTGSLARWQNVTRTTLADWRSATFQDFNSLNVDPDFVSLLGSDGVLGYVNATNDGRDDDLHLRSQYGTFQGVALAPVATALGTGVPAWLVSPGNPVLFTTTSKLIDRGAPADSFAAEPLPNGGAINIGAYGGTSQASISPAEYVTVTNPDGAEVWPQGQTFAIRWRNQQPGPSPVTFTLELLKGGVSVQTITSNAPDTGSFSWTVPPGTVVGDDYRIRVTRNDNTAIQDVSDNNFSIRLPISVYYVNDGTVAAGDFTTTIGNDANSGLSPDAPKGSISAVLAAYSLKPGDTILVDAGTYTLSTALILNAAASGITIRGFHDPADPTRVTVLDRANTQFNAIELVNADDVTLDRLTIRNANYGVFASSTSDSDRLTISNSVLGINSTGAIFLDSGSDWTSLQSNRITHRGAWLRGTDATVNANTFVGVTAGNGLEVSGLRSLVTNNTFSGINGGALRVSTSGASNITRVDVRENSFIDVGNGIQATENTLIRNNSFTRASTAIFSVGEVRNNIIREGVNGIVALATTSIIDNRILLVSGSGIMMGASSTTRGNYLYNNATGISATGFTGVIANNFLVNNTTAGIAIASGSPTLTNNTVIQATGDAIRVTNVGTQNVNVRNNILQVSSGYALNVDSAASPGFQSDYNVIHRLGTGRISRWQDSDYNSPADWYYEVGLDKNSIFGDPLFVDLDGPDNLLGFVNGAGDFGLDDNFTVVAASPAIDGGNPNDLFFREPLSGGSRINIGAGGNTPLAEASPLQRVQVLSPSGLEKFEHGQTTNIQVRSHGMLSSQPTLLLNMGTNVVGPWGAGSAFQTSGIPSGFFGNEFTNAVIDRSGVVDPVPEELYRTYLSSDTGTAATLRLQLPVPDGTYSLRMHFIEGIVTAIGTRRFDIKVNGATVSAGYDIFASAGARFRAVAESFTGVSAVGGGGLTIELTTLTPTLPALLAALEVFTATPLGTPTSSISLQVSGDGGNQWSPIPGAEAIPLDRWGNASFLWTIPSDLPEGDNYRIRARSNAVAGGIIDESESSFRITHAGTQYYVNDNSLAGDVLTTAIGNNSASGKSPDQPMASLAALLTSYNFGPGDVIYIDSGVHRLNRTLTLNSSISGVSFEGASSGTAILDRNNLLQNMFVLQNADDLSFQRLTFRNAQYSFFSNDSSDSDRLTIANSSFVSNQTGSIFLGQGSDFTSLQNNSFNLTTPTTATLGGADSVVTGNQFSNSTGATLALEVRGARTQVTGNTLSNIRSGISVQPNYIDSPANRVVISGNVITDASGTAINVNAPQTLVENNQVVRAAMGISGTARIRQNILRGGTTGMSVSNSLVENNRIFNHTGTGLFAGAGTVTRSNRIYNNNVGIETGFGFNGTLSNNYLVNNSTAGFLLSGAGYNGGVPTFSQNTIIQAAGIQGAGDAFRVIDFRTNNILIENNIIQVGQGYAYNVDAGTTRGFVANYNLIHRTGTGKIARWEATDFNDAADWYYEVGMDQHSVFENPLFVDLDGPDNQLGFNVQSSIDYGADDNFSVQAFSPAMDRGNPNTAYALEPLPNGGRINLGGSAGSILAETSAPQLVQVLSPQGLEKFERGQSVPIAVNTNGLRNIQPTLLINGGSLAAGRWQPASRVTTSGFAGPLNTALATATIDRSGVVDPPPEEVYRTYTTTDFNPGLRVAMTLPLADGNYSVRLHFIEHEWTTIGARRFDIRINGATVRNSYDIFAAAGSVRFRATAETFTNIVTTGGAGLTLELVNVSGIPATIAAIEVFQASPLGMAAPTVALDFSSNGGESWTPIPGAQAVPVDRWGNASFNWTVPNDAPQSNGYRIRARAIGASGAISSTSPQSFSVAGSGQAYFLSPSGDNRNNGKSIDQPMRSLSGLVAAYDLDAGDVVELIGGNYRTYRNIQLGQEDSGVTFLASLDSPATITRGNSNDSMRVIDFTGADGVTINGLRLTGGEDGIFVANGSSNNNALTNSHLYGNLNAGLRIGTGNVGWTITSSRFYGLPGGQTSDDQAHGILFDAASINTSTGYQIIGNEIYDHAAIGISQPPAGSLIQANAIYGNQQGITATGEIYAVPLVIRGNSVRNNLSWGISVNSSGIEVTDNDVFGHSGPGDRGIIANGGSVITNNRIYNNHIGADAFSGTGPNPTRLSGNRIYGNSSVGVAPNAFANIDGNYIYSNSIGVQTGSQFFGNLSNNIIYANTNRGLSIQNPFSGSGNARYINNTVYQTVGDGIRLEGGARNNQLINNIVWVLSGNAVSVANDSQVGFQSDYNLLHVSDNPNANIGLWNGVARKTLTDWQTASSQDANSLTGAPGFVDIDGADNVLGYVTSAGGNVHGGNDDNFYVTRNSPTIDRGHTWQGVPMDIDGLPRSDDPGTVNAGTSRYIQISPQPNFSLSGTAQNWRADNGFWSLTLPFAFPLFGTSYNTVWVTSNGMLQISAFENSLADFTNTTAELSQWVRIAGLWDDLRTDGTPEDNIFIDNTVSGATTIRWNATNKADNSDVNFSVTLFATGEVIFNYGPGNTNLTPTIGISRGNNRDIHLATGFDGAANLTGPRAVGFQVVPGITDMGAYEFRGSSLDVQPPTLVASSPAAIHASGVTTLALSSLQLSFSEEVNPIDARSPAAYQLRSAGVNNLFDDADDVVYPLRPGYAPGQNSVQLVIGALDGGPGISTLPIGRYRITVLGSASSSLYDLAGNRFDGNADGNAGGNYVRSFKVISNGAPQLFGTNQLPTIKSNISNVANTGMRVVDLVANQIVDSDGPAQGIAVMTAGTASGSWEYSLDGSSFWPIAPALVGGRRLLLAADADTRVRFVPGSGSAGFVTDLQVQAWDQADEIAEGTSVLPADLSANSLSAASYPVAILVQAPVPPTISVQSTSVTGEVLSPLANSGTYNGENLAEVVLSASLGTVTKNANGTWSWTYSSPARLVNQTVTITATDEGGQASVTFTVDALTVVRSGHVFYKGSGYGQTVDPAKTVQKAESNPRRLNIANLINSSRGLNGLVFDIPGLISSSLMLGDFVFRMSPTGLFNEAANPPASWMTAPSPSLIEVTAGNATTAAQLRLEWPDNAIANRWLQVIVRANPSTGLNAPAVFYMGHLKGEINGQTLGNAFIVSNADLALLLPLGGIQGGVPSDRDVNKDRFVLNSDGIEIRSSIQAGLTLRAITIPASGSAAEGAPLDNNSPPGGRSSVGLPGSPLGKSQLNSALAAPLWTDTSRNSLPVINRAQASEFGSGQISLAAGSRLPTNQDKRIQWSLSASTSSSKQANSTSMERPGHELDTQAVDDYFLTYDHQDLST